MTVNGSINVEDDGIQIDNYNSANTVTVNGNIDAGEDGIYVTDANGNAVIDITVNGNVTGEDEAIDVDSFEDQSKLHITVNGDVTGGDDAIYINEVEKDASMDITVNGNVQGNDNGLYLDNYGKFQMTVTDDVTTDYDDAIGAYTYYGGSTDINVMGNLNGEDGIAIYTEEGSSTTIKVGKDINATDDGIYSYAEDEKSIAKVDVGGSVNAAYTGVYAGSGFGAKNEINIAKDVNSISNNEGDLPIFVMYRGTGVGASAYYGGETTVTVGGNVTGSGIGASLYAGNNDYDELTSDETPTSIVNLSVGGNLVGGGAGIIASISNEDSTIDVLVENVLSANEDGVPVLLGSRMIGSDVDYSDQTTLTVWKVELNKDGMAAAEIDYENTPMVEMPLEEFDGIGGREIRPVYKEATEFEKTIKYIIKVEQPTEGATLAAKNAQGENLEQSHDYDIAYEGDKVLLKVDLEPGYKILAAYNGDGEKQPLIMDSDGNYYINVPKGGGVYLSVSLEKEKYEIKFVDDDDTELQKEELEYGDTPVFKGQEPTKESTAQFDYEFIGWNPEINPVTGEVTYKAAYKATTRSHSISFDLDGGTLDGQTGTYTLDVEYGSIITLGTPTKDGYEFLYWQGSKYYAGDKYTVQDGHTFKAIWRKLDPSNSGSKSSTKHVVATPTQPSATTTGVVIPNTSTTGHNPLYLELWYMMIGTSALLFFATFMVWMHKDA